uniref:Uncharacterized protein n=1 Tax=Panagrellus redivivus TaxID=6233 RepID=A0A7E4UTD4_PANRE
MSRRQIQSNINSIDFSTLPYSFQCRLIDLTPPHALSKLRRTGHSIHKLTSRRGYFARSLYITQIKPLQRFIDPLEENKIFGSRILTLDEALKFKHLYVRKKICFALKTPNEKLRSLLVRTYTDTVFACGLAMSDITKFLHPRLFWFHLCDRNVLKTKQAMDIFVKFLLWFTQNGKRTMIRATLDSVPPQFCHELETIVERERPLYHVFFKDGNIIIKYKKLFNNIR